MDNYQIPDFFTFYVDMIENKLLPIDRFLHFPNENHLFWQIIEINNVNSGAKLQFVYRITKAETCFRAIFSVKFDYYWNRILHKFIYCGLDVFINCFWIFQNILKYSLFEELKTFDGFSKVSSLLVKFGNIFINKK